VTLTYDRYIEEEMDFEARRAKDRNHELAMFAGYKFEERCTLEKTWDESSRKEIETRNENVVDNIQQYCSVVRTQLGSSTIIIGGEVDCLWGTSLPFLDPDFLILRSTLLSLILSLLSLSELSSVV
jgi:hypothetical protein